MPLDAAQVRQRAMDMAKRVVPADARSRLVRTRMDLRQRSAGWRTLPDVLIIGGMRCGTSSLYKYLGYHPSVAPSLQKESEYFTRHFRRGENWYRAHFPLTARKELHNRIGRDPLITFEASPYYLYHPRAAARAAELVPAARIIVMLRDPVERAYSHWQHMTLHGLETLSFEDALAAEESRLEPELERMAADPMYFSEIDYHFSYVARGKYAPQLERWLEAFPPDAFLVIRSEDFYADEAAVYADILKFLGVKAWVPARFENYSYLGAGVADASVTKSASTIDPVTRERLEREFEADQRRLPAVLEGLRHAGPAPAARET